MASEYDQILKELKEIKKAVKSIAKRIGGDTGIYNKDEILDNAIKLVRESRTATAGFLQRKLSIGYARAAELLELMEEKGVIGPQIGTKPRKVL
jgi:DNA segregation ATPase FtsK/SpoIIIE-like protein